MATNKRKDAAALFELIDKSTLKVPKHAGALKIPDWWSSKTNPASETPAPTGGEGNAKAGGRTPAKTSTVAPAAATPEGSATTRLFEPPAANAPPSVSPSIRPPTLNGAAKSTPAAAVSTPPAAPETPRASTETQDASPHMVSSTPRSTAGSDLWKTRTTPSWPSTGVRRRGRRPPWVMPAVIALGVFFLLLVVVGIILARRHSQGSTSIPPTGAGSSTVEGTGSDTHVGGGLLPPPGAHPTMPSPAGGQPAIIENDSGNAGGGTTVEGDSVIPEGTTGKVYGPGTVQRSADQFYVMISSTPSATVAQKNADFLAHHGVDVSIEVVAGPGTKNNRWYKLISVKGFPSMVAAEPFRKQIVQIGHLHPDFKKYKKVWDDAFVTRVVSVK